MSALEQRVLDAFAAVDAGHARSQQRRPGVSELGRCTRAFAAKLADLPHDVIDVEPAAAELRARYTRTATIGTWVHAGLLPVLATLFADAADELPVTFEGIDGSVDLYSRRDATLVDVKTCSTYAFERVLQHGVKRDHVRQTHGYAGALRDAGLPVERIAVVHVNRSSAEVHVVELTVDDELIVDLRAWVREAVEDAERLRAGAPLDSVPIGEERRGPGHDLTCDSCPFRLSCWGELTPPQQKLARDEPSVIAALQLYADASARESAAKRDKSFVRDVLAVVEPGTYGTFRYSRSAPSVVIMPRTVDELTAVCFEHDVPLEALTRESKRDGSIRVTPVKPK